MLLILLRLIDVWYCACIQFLLLCSDDMSRCAYVLVCEVEENYMQAEAILVAIANLVAEHITSQEQENAEVR